MPPPARMRWMSAITNFLRQTKTPKDVIKFIGEDHLGNRYYEAERANNPKKIQRYYERKVKPENITDAVDLTHVPPAWHAWLRFTRKEPPSQVEIQEGEEYYNYQQALATAKKDTAREELAKKDKNIEFPKLPLDQ